MDERVVLPRRFYRDPLDVIMHEESKTCLGCTHVAIAFGAEFCVKGKRLGRRCGLYREVKRGEG